MPDLSDSSSFSPGDFTQRLQDPWKVINEFKSTYWSGLEMSMYMEGVEIGETTQLSYQIVEQVRPYYGYHSYIPTHIFHGSRLVAGEFTVNFRRYGETLRLLADISAGTIGERVPIVKDPEPSIPSMPFGGSLTGFPGILAGTIGEILKNMSPEQIREFVNKAKKDQAIVEPPIEDIKTQPEFTATVLPNLSIFQTRKEGFDLDIIFGGRVDNSLTLQYIGTESFRYDSNNPAVEDPEIDLRTGIRLYGVSITGNSQSIVDDGRPIMETYTFLARNVGTISFNANRMHG